MRAGYCQRKNVLLFVNIKLASPVAGSSESIFAGLRTQSDAKKKRINNVYSCNASYKKLKNPKVSIEDSEMESKTSSVSGLSDLENMKNTVTEETSYADSDASMVNDMENDTTPRKTHTHTYVLDQLPKTSSFDILSDNNNMAILLSPKFAGFKELQSVRLYASDKCIFDLVKSFTLDIRISVLLSKTISNKLIAVKKFFYWVDSFGNTSALSKLPDIIRSFFTSELSLIKARKMVISKKILVNINVKKPNSCSDWEVIVKKIPVDLPRSAIESVFSKFGQVILIRMQLIRLWQKALVEFELSDVVSSVAFKWSVFVDKDSVYYYRTLLYTLPVGTTVYDLLDLVNSYNRKTCFIGRNSGSYAHNRCAMICFDNEASKLAAIGFVLVYRGVALCWTGLSLACCAKCKQFGHISNVCSVGGNSGVCHKRVMSSQDQVCLANIYKKKQTLVACPVFFVAGGSLFHMFLLVLSGASSLLSTKPLVITFNPLDNSGLAKCLASLEHSLELLLDQVSNILKKLSLVNLVSISLLPCAPSSLVASLLDSVLDLNMAVDNIVVPSSSSFPLVNKTAPDLSLSSSKMLTTKIGGLKSKMLALEVLVNLVLERLDFLCSGLGLLAPPLSQ
ncbi:hypothetical protein G9A89_002778 [Geosiphon pyriformis]|nr:hypothetical protein G9A89_002778 [Geosiphon pyriformis]